MAHVVVIGGANVDIKGRASAPYVPATSNPGEVTISAGGVGRNIADNLSRLGVGVSLLTALGDDANGQFLRHACDAAGVDISLSLTAREATGTYLAILDEAGEMVSALSDMRAIERLEPADLEAVAKPLSAADMLVADCNISAGCLAWLCAFSARSKVPLLIEPVSVAKARKLLAFEREEPVFAITPNAQQLRMLAGGEVARLHGLGFSNIVVHMGAEGSLASDGAQSMRVEPAVAALIADVTGAGDAAVAGLVFGVLEGLPLAKAARLGQYAAAIKLGSSQSVALGLNRDKLLQMQGL